MSYSPKHNSTKEDTSVSTPEKTRKQKPLIIALLAVLAVVIVVSLILLLRSCASSSDDANKPVFGGNDSDGYVPETQDGTTNISIYYEDGIVPTTGSVHNVTIIEGGGANVRDVEGKWNLDDNTYLQFDGQGKGFMHVANDKEHLHFRYSAENGVLAIDMDSDASLDKEYHYELDGDSLTLTNSDGQVYNLTKVDE